MPRRKLEGLTRLGFAARGLMYILIGYFAFQSRRAEDGPAAIARLHGGGGTLLVALMALGFAAYGLWRLADACLDHEHHGSGGKGIAARLGGFGSGLIYLGLAVFAARLVMGIRGQAGNSSEAGAQTALHLPGGQTLLFGAAFVLLLVGAFQLIKAAKGSFLDRLDPRAAKADWVRITGRIGYAARGLVFLMMAWFFGRAGLEGSPAEAGGVDDALTALPYTFRLVVAFGLSLFGLFSLVEARHRLIRNPADMLPDQVR